MGPPFVVRMWTERRLLNGQMQMLWHRSIFNVETEEHVRFKSFSELATALRQQAPDADT